MVIWGEIFSVKNIHPSPLWNKFFCDDDLEQMWKICFSSQFVLWPHGTTLWVYSSDDLFWGKPETYLEYADWWPYNLYEVKCMN